jgi:hypothetical protein
VRELGIFPKKRGVTVNINDVIKGLAVPEIQMPKINFQEIGPIARPQFVINAEQGIASKFYKRLSEWITNFDKSLDDNHEVGVRLVSFGQSMSFHLEGMGYYNPFLISFSGFTEDGQPVELIQHVNQISILLMKLPRKNPNEPKKPIGFNIGADD